MAQGLARLGVDPPVAPAGGRPWFERPQIRNVTALLGRTAYLSCTVRALGNRTVSWVRHRDIHLLTVGEFTFTNDQRFRALHSPASRLWTLQLKFVQHRDAGMYACQVSSSPPVSYPVYLSVVAELARAVQSQCRAPPDTAELARAVQSQCRAPPETAELAQTLTVQCRAPPDTEELARAVQCRAPPDTAELAQTLTVQCRAPPDTEELARAVQCRAPPDTAELARAVQSQCRAPPDTAELARTVQSQCRAPPETAELARAVQRRAPPETAELAAG
ncbi:Zwei Ig domain protein zig-8 [Amphibalanus amphitrite]|uniref:Zwei Ig domain protein zig-8 n=1 Tax=Amphibalanus amphitrite TaxID=1232801 RepID=A0A6A4W1I2_AMPAM|nr:Zwei Ig domain protein zig-8 [Amphibalanus amphitrite]